MDDDPLTETSPAPPHLVVISVPQDSVDELVQSGLAARAPILRGELIEAVIAVGVDSAALVTLLQTPQTIQAFATWIRARVIQKEERITIRGNRGNRALRVDVDGDVPVEAIARFLREALGDED